MGISGEHLEMLFISAAVYGERYSCIRKPQSYPQSYAQVWDLLVENVQKAVDNSVGELGKTVDKSAKISAMQQGCG